MKPREIPNCRQHLLGFGDLHLEDRKLHPKKSTYSEHGAQWRRIGCDSNSRIASLTVAISKSKLSRIRLEAMSLAREQAQPKLGFFAGSIFWFNPKTFRPLVGLDEAVLSFEREMAHRRAPSPRRSRGYFCTVSRSQGFRNTSVRLGGQELDETDASHNRVPVLLRQDAKRHGTPSRNGPIIGQCSRSKSGDAAAASSGVAL